MNITEAKAAIGRRVVYTASHGAQETGLLTSVNARYAFVRYGSDAISKATPPEMLTLETSPAVTA